MSRKAPALERLRRSEDRHHWVHIADQWTKEEKKEMYEYLQRKLPNEIFRGEKHEE